MEDAKHCPTYLLSDKPESEDSDFGTHNRVAKALEDLIITEKGGRSIALEGSYGAGKTTVIKILRSLLKKDKNYTLIPFDAWAHEKDPLRRTFLETLIKHIRDLGWVDSDEWEKQLELIAQKREIRTTKSTPQLTGLGKFVGLTLFAIPVGIAFLNASLRDNVTIEWGNPIAWKVVIGFLCTLAPLFAILIGLSLSTIKRIRLRWAWLPFKLAPGESTASQIWALLFNKTITEEKTETAKTPNPTSIEFEEIFSDLMKEALIDPARRAVIVLDNLDRVDVDDALSIWSTLQTFLGLSHYKRLPWLERLWIIVLYDPVGINRLWDGEKTDGTKSSAFIQKSFQVRFRVPVPLPSDWRSYLVKLLKRALPKHSEAEFHSVSQVFNLAKENPPTIRELKTFVNQIGAIHRQWHDEFPISHIAYFVSHCDRENMPNRLRADDFPGERALDVLAVEGEEGLAILKANLAALYFNVEVAAAQQLLLGSAVEQALYGGYGNVNELSKLAKANKGFWELLERTIDGNPFANRGDLIAVAANTLEESNLLVKSNDPAASSIKSAMCRLAAKGNLVWSHLVPASARGVCAIFRWKDDAHFALTLLKDIAGQIVNHDEGQNRTITVHAWVEPLKILASGLKTSGFGEDFDEGVILSLANPLREPNKLQVKTLSDSLELLAGLRLPETSSDKILRELAEAGHILHQLGQVWYERLQAAATSVRDTKKNKNATPEGNTPTESKPDPSLIDATAWCMYIYIYYVPDLRKPPDVGFSLQGYEHLSNALKGTGGFYDFKDKFLSILKDLNELNLLTELLERSPLSRPFIGACLRSIDTRDYGKLNITPDFLVGNWSLLRSELDKRDPFSTKFGSLVQTLMRSGLMKFLMATDFNPHDAALYVEILMNGAERDKSFGSWCQTGLNKLSQKEWEEQLADRGNLSTLAVLYATFTGLEFELGEEYQSALLSHAQKVITQVGIKEEQRANLASPLGGGTNRTEFRNSLLDLALSTGGALPEYFFSLFREELFDAKVLESKKNLLGGMLIPLVERGNCAGVRWAADLLKMNASVLDKYSNIEVENLQKAVLTAIKKGGMYEARDAIRDIAVAMKLEYEEVTTPTEKEKQLTSYPSPGSAEEERRLDGMWQVFIGIGGGFKVGLMKNVIGSEQIMCFGVGENGESTYYEELDVVETLKKKGLVRVSQVPSTKMFKEFYEFTEKGRRLFEEVEFLPEPDRYEAGLSRLKSV